MRSLPVSFPRERRENHVAVTSVIGEKGGKKKKELTVSDSLSIVTLLVSAAIRDRGLS